MAKINEINTVNQQGQALLHLAAEQGNTDAIKLLINIKEVDINLKDKWGRTPLNLAVNYKHEKAAKLLILAGANINAVDNIQLSPLLMAVDNNIDNIDFVKFLIDEGADVNAVNKYGQTPLHLAITNSNTKVINYLINEKINVNAVNQHGQTPLHLAAEQGNTDVIKLLINIKEVDINLKDEWNSTPLDIITEENNIDAIKFLVSAPIVHKLFGEDTIYSESTHMLIQNHFNITFNFEYDEKILKEVFNSLFVKYITQKIEQGAIAVFELLKLIHDNVKKDKLFFSIIDEGNDGYTNLTQKVIKGSKLENLISYDEFKQEVRFPSLKEIVLLFIVKEGIIKTHEELITEDLLTELNKISDLVHNYKKITKDAHHNEDSMMVTGETGYIKEMTEDAHHNEDSMMVTGETGYIKEMTEDAYHNEDSMMVTGETGYIKEMTEDAYHNENSIIVTGETEYLN